MINDLNETRVRTIEQVRAILEGTEAFEFVVPTDTYARCAWIALELGRLHYRQMKRASRGLVLEYLRRFSGFSGFSRAHANRLVRPKGAPSNAFARRYTDADLDALTEVEREYGKLSGPPTMAVLRRMYEVYGDERFVICTLTTGSALASQERSTAGRYSTASSEGSTCLWKVTRW